MSSVDCKKSLIREGQARETVPEEATWLSQPGQGVTLLTKFNLHICVDIVSP